MNSICWPEDSHILRLNNLRPHYFVLYKDTIIDLVRRGVIGLLKIPIQSGCQYTLDRMNRNCDIKKVGEVIDLIKEIDSSVIIMTDIIVGYPEETNTQVDMTIEFVKKKIDVGRIFIFSAKKIQLQTN